MTSNTGSCTPFFTIFVLIFLLPNALPQSTLAQVHPNINNVLRRDHLDESAQCPDQSTTRKTSQFRRYNLTMCAMVRNEMPYILEWIEHHRLQGVDRFLLYDDGSTDDTVLLGQLYQRLGHEGLVEVLPLNIFRYNQPPRQPDASTMFYDQRQQHALNHCNSRSILHSKWVIVVDVDEFVYAPNYHTVWEFLESRHNETVEPVDVNVTVSEFYITPVRYGSSGVLHNFHGHLHVDPYDDGEIRVVTDTSGREHEFPMILTANPRRAPHQFLDSDYEMRYNATCRDHVDPGGCIHAAGKSIWKPERCTQAGVHSCQVLSGRSYHVNITHELRLNHYAFKSREHVEGLLEKMKPIKKAAFDNFDQSWFSSQWDPIPETVVRAVTQALAKFTVPNPG